MRFGPPNTRIIGRIESEDFVHWSPKVTMLALSALDAPQRTCFDGMSVMPYEGVYLGVLTAYHGETLGPIPDAEPWTDRKDLQLAFSRNGVAWLRVGKYGAIPHRELAADRDWKTAALEAAFLPYGQRDRGWDWGTIYAFQAPLVVGDEIRIYYMGQNGRNWWNYRGDPPELDPQAARPRTAIGLATLRLDGFVAVEALDSAGHVLDGFARSDCEPLAGDEVHHLLKWRGSTDCRRIQARPARLRFCLTRARLYSFTPRIVADPHARQP